MAAYLCDYLLRKEKPCWFMDQLWAEVSFRDSAAGTIDAPTGSTDLKRRRFSV
jgi:hypothetical protein